MAWKCHCSRVKKTSHAAKTDNIVTLDAIEEEWIYVYVLARWTFVTGYNVFFIVAWRFSLALEEKPAALALCARRAERKITAQ